MNNQDQKLLALRPILPVVSPEGSEMGQFQVATLRPVLKMQNERILQIFQDYLAENKADYQTFSTEQKKKFIENALTKRKDLKFLLIGLLIGHFTSAEYAFYQNHRAEIHKRLTRFLAKRIFDGLG